MEVIARPTGEGYVATDDSTYPTLAALLAAGKTAFPGLEREGIYPSAVDFTSLVAAGNGAGDYFEFRVNADTPPTVGVPVQGAGQHFIEAGFSGINKQLIQNVYVLNKETAGDIISCVALYG